jgi:hypothetical protein
VLHQRGVNGDADVKGTLNVPDFLAIDEAAAYVGMSVGEFWDAVFEGIISDPIPLTVYKWSRTDLDAAQMKRKRKKVKH